MRHRVSQFLFYLGVGFLFSHELDAVVQAEWRLLYFLRSLPEAEAMQMFIWLHVPLFGILVWLTHHRAQGVRFWSRVVFAAFLVVHGGLHFRLSTHPLYSFDSLLSMLLIYGGAAAGLAYLLAVDWSAKGDQA